MDGVSRGRFLARVVLFSGVLCMLGCALPSTVARPARERGVAGGGEVVPRLVARAERPELLSSVNSIEIVLPTVPNSGGVVTVSPELARDTIERTARETMTLDIRNQRLVARAGSRPVHDRGADAVLETELLRFEDRAGSSVGGDPAVISFRMSMLAVPSGKEIWGAQYFYRQEAVSENLLRLNERVGAAGYGAGWRSAQELFERGVREALQDFNNRREQRFLAAAR
jgi:hypothetical protein